MRNIGNRLKAICELAKGSKRIADVGCDHGKVLDYLIKNTDVEFVVASDISAPSVQKAQKLLENQKNVQFSVRVGDGFTTLSNNDMLDTIIVAGMGGLEIINILSSDKIKNLKIPKLILQPQNNVVKLRSYLNKSNFKITKDFVVLDRGKFYIILLVQVGKQVLSEQQLKFGVECLNPDETTIKYLLSLKQKYQKRLNLVKNQQKEELINEINQIDCVIRKDS